MWLKSSSIWCLLLFYEDRDEIILITSYSPHWWKSYLSSLDMWYWEEFESHIHISQGKRPLHTMQHNTAVAFRSSEPTLDVGGKSVVTRQWGAPCSCCRMWLACCTILWLVGKCNPLGWWQARAKLVQLTGELAGWGDFPARVKCIWQKQKNSQPLWGSKMYGLEVLGHTLLETKISLYKTRGDC